MKAVMLIEKEDCIIEHVAHHYLLRNEDLHFGLRVEEDELEEIWQGSTDAYFSVMCDHMEVILRITPSDALSMSLEVEED